MICRLHLGIVIRYSILQLQEELLQVSETNISHNQTLTDYDQFSLKLEIVHLDNFLKRI